MARKHQTRPSSSSSSSSSSSTSSSSSSSSGHHKGRKAKHGPAPTYYNVTAPAGQRIVQQIIPTSTATQPMPHWAHAQCQTVTTQNPATVGVTTQMPATVVVTAHKPVATETVNPVYTATANPVYGATAPGAGHSIFQSRPMVADNSFTHAYGQPSTATPLQKYASQSQPSHQVIAASNAALQDVHKDMPKAGQTDSLTVSTGNFGQEAAQPKAWVTVPVPDKNGGLQFRPRGFSADGSADTESNWDIKHKYMIAQRTGPTEVPDHIIAKHRGFPKGHAGFKSPYSVFYFDETAPNDVLLDNDVLRRDKQSHTSVLHATDKNGAPVKGAVRPKRRVSVGSSRSTTESDGSEAALPDHPAHFNVQEGGMRTAPRGEGMNPRGTGGGSSRTSSRSTEYVSLQPQERAGCCGARKQVDRDGGSYYGDSITSHSRAKYEAAAPLEYVTGGVSDGLTDISSLTSDSGVGHKFELNAPMPYEGAPGQSVFDVPGELPPSYPMRESTTTSSSYTSTEEQPQQRRRACCGVRRRHSVGTSSSCTTSNSTSSESYTSSSGTTSTSSTGQTSSSSMPSRVVHPQQPQSAGIVATNTTTTSYSGTANSRGTQPKCRACCGRKCDAGPGDRRTVSVETSSGQYATSREDKRRSAREIPMTESGTGSYVGTRSATNSADGDGRGVRTGSGRKVPATSEKSKQTTSSTGSYSGSARSSSAIPNGSRPGGARHFLFDPRDDGSSYSGYETGWERGVPPIIPSKKREGQRDMHYNVRKMFFDVDDMRVPENGTGMKMLPGHSVSYRNFPVIAYDVIAPREYQDFFRVRKTPGMCV